MINWIYYGGNLDAQYGFLATKVVGDVVEIWVATELDTRLLHRSASNFPVNANTVRINTLQDGTELYYMFLNYDYQFVSGSGYYGATITPTGTVRAQESETNFAAGADVFSLSPLVRGFWPQLTETAGGQDIDVIRDRFFSNSVFIPNPSNLNFIVPLPDLFFLQGTAEFTQLAGLSVNAFLPSQDYTGSLAFDSDLLGGLSRTRPVAWVADDGTITPLTGGVFEQNLEQVGFIDTGIATNDWLLAFPFAYRLTAAPSINDDTLQARTLEKWEINLTAGTITLLGTVSVNLRGFNDAALSYKAFALNASVLAGLPVV